MGDEGWKRAMSQDLCAIRERIARIEGRLAGKHQEPYISRDGVNIARVLVTHWKTISAIVAFIALWSRSGVPSAVNADKIDQLQKVVALMVQNW